MEAGRPWTVGSSPKGYKPIFISIIRTPSRLYCRRALKEMVLLFKLLNLTTTSYFHNLKFKENLKDRSTTFQQQCAVCCRDEASQGWYYYRDKGSNMERKSVWRTSKKRQELDSLMTGRKKGGIKFNIRGANRGRAARGCYGASMGIHSFIYILVRFVLHMNVQESFTYQCVCDNITTQLSAVQG
jgi:hypothetical protein